MHTDGLEDARLNRTIQVQMSKGDKLFVAECLNLPVVSQAATLDELAKNIKEAIHLHLAGEDLAELGFCVDPTIVATIQMGTVT